MHHEVIMTRTAQYYSEGMVRHILAPVSVDIDKVAINKRPVWIENARGRSWPDSDRQCVRVPPSIIHWRATQRRINHGNRKPIVDFSTTLRSKRTRTRCSIVLVAERIRVIIAPKGSRCSVSDTTCAPCGARRRTSTRKAARLTWSVS